MASLETYFNTVHDSRIAGRDLTKGVAIELVADFLDKMIGQVNASPRNSGCRSANRNVLDIDIECRNLVQQCSRAACYEGSSAGCEMHWIQIVCQRHCRTGYQVSGLSAACRTSRVPDQCTIEAADDGHVAAGRPPVNSRSRQPVAINRNVNCQTVVLKPPVKFKSCVCGRKTVAASNRDCWDRGMRHFHLR
jgi:hypothetical protein